MENTMIVSSAAERHPELIRRGQGSQILDLGEKHGFDFRFIGVAPAPEEPVFVPGWWIVPAAQDQSEIPERSLQRVKLLLQAGILPQSFVIVHEVPQVVDVPQLPQMIPPKIKSGWITGESITGHTTLPILAGVLAGISAVLVPLLFIGSLALIDPILIAITQEQEWIEIDRWDVERR